MFAEKEKRTSYKQTGFVSSAFPVYSSIISDVTGSEHGERTMVHALSTDEKKRLEGFE